MKVKLTFLLLLLFCSGGCFAVTTIKLLPSIDIVNGKSLNTIIKERRSVRKFVASKQLTLQQVAQLLWAAQGVTTENHKFRSVPSAGALYPLELYLVQDDGVWHYEPMPNSITLVTRSNISGQLANAALDQNYLKNAAATIIIAADYERTTNKYGKRGIAYVYMEAGAVMQNILLEATNLGLCAVPIGAFHDQEIKRLLKMPENQQPLLIIPVG